MEGDSYIRTQEQSEISNIQSIQNKSLVIKDQQVQGKVKLNKKMMKTKNSMATKKHQKQFLTDEDINDLILVGRKQCIFFGVINLIVSAGYLGFQILRIISYDANIISISLLSSISIMVIVQLYQLILIINVVQNQFRLSIYLLSIAYILVIAGTITQICYKHIKNSLYLILPILFLTCMIILGIILIILVNSAIQIYNLQQLQDEDKQEEERQKKLITDESQDSSMIDE